MIPFDFTKTGTTTFVCKSCGDTMTIINSVLSGDDDVFLCRTCRKTMINTSKKIIDNNE